MLRAGEMPPEGAKQPTKEELATALMRLRRPHHQRHRLHADQGARAARRSGASTGSSTTIPSARCSRSRSRPPRIFAPDGSSYGFDNISDALSISPLQVEQYFQAAETVLDALFKDRKALAGLEHSIRRARAAMRAWAP